MGTQVQAFEGAARVGGFLYKSKTLVGGQLESRGIASQADPSTALVAGGGLPQTSTLC